jgi:hypothetical protein
MISLLFGLVCVPEDRGAKLSLFETLLMESIVVKFARFDVSAEGWFVTLRASVTGHDNRCQMSRPYVYEQLAIYHVG